MDSGCKSYLEDTATCCAKTPVRIAACWRCRKPCTKKRSDDGVGGGGVRGGGGGSALPLTIIVGILPVHPSV